MPTTYTRRWSLQLGAAAAAGPVAAAGPDLPPPPADGRERLVSVLPADAADLDRILPASERERPLASAAADDEAGLVEVELDLAVGRERGRRERQHDRRQRGGGERRCPTAE